MKSFAELVEQRQSLQNYLAQNPTSLAERLHSDERVAALQRWSSATAMANSALAHLRTAASNPPYRSASSGTFAQPAAAMRRLADELSAWMQRYDARRIYQVSPQASSVPRSMTFDANGSWRAGSWRPSFAREGRISGSQFLALQLDYDGNLDSVPGKYAAALSVLSPIISEARIVYQSVLAEKARQKAIKDARSEALAYLQSEAKRRWVSGWKVDAGHALTQAHFFNLGPRLGASFERDYKAPADAALTWASGAIGMIDAAQRDLCRVAGCPTTFAVQWSRVAVDDVGNTSYPTVRTAIAQHFQQVVKQQGWTSSDIVTSIQDEHVRAIVEQAIARNVQISAADIARQRDIEQARVNKQLEEQRRSEEARKAAELRAAEEARSAEAARMRAAEEQRAREAAARAAREAQEARLDAVREKAEEKKGSAQDGPVLIVSAPPVLPVPDQDVISKEITRDIEAAAVIDASSDVGEHSGVSVPAPPNGVRVNVRFVEPDPTKADPDVRGGEDTFTPTFVPAPPAMPVTGGPGSNPDATVPVSASLADGAKAAGAAAGLYALGKLLRII